MTYWKSFTKLISNTLIEVPVFKWLQLGKTWTDNLRVLLGKKGNHIWIFCFFFFSVWNSTANTKDVSFCWILLTCGSNLVKEVELYPMGLFTVDRCQVMDGSWHLQKLGLKPSVTRWAVACVSASMSVTNDSWSTSCHFHREWSLSEQCQTLSGPWIWPHKTKH